ncbi:hypothetical protein BJY01DRAFT_10305 [Aspergillus pseudoustus]|uniref:Uncharacterized protein n=1 Tax=Aspergillus pseudoustus TaxID=1810923 RepID=A0ABR4KU27_9EURO
MGGDPAPNRALRSNNALPNQPPSAYKVFTEIRASLLSNDRTEVEVRNLPSSIGSIVFDALSEDKDVEERLPRMTYDAHTSTFFARNMPTKIHDVPQMWLSNEISKMQAAKFLSDDERDNFDTTVGTTFNDFVAPYTNSRKEPDWALIPITDKLPSVVLESGWSDNWPKLLQAMRLWLEGGRPNVQLVFLFNWGKRTNNSVAGEVRVYERTLPGATNERFRASIFPIPQGGPGGIPLTRAEMFGVSGVLPGRNATDRWHLSLTRLREIADRWVRAMGLTPVS